MLEKVILQAIECSAQENRRNVLLRKEKEYRRSLNDYKS